MKILYAQGTTKGSIQSPSNSTLISWTNANFQTANTFGSGDLYITNYASSNYKSISTNGVAENNGASDNYLTLANNLWSNTAAITSVTIAANIDNFVQYSSFYLYGIKNS